MGFNSGFKGLKEKFCSNIIEGIKQFNCCFGYVIIIIIIMHAKNL